MKKLILTLTILALTACFSTTAFGADVAKIGVISFEKIMNESSAGKFTQKQLKAKWAKLEKELIAEKKTIEELSLTMERESMIVSPEKKRAKQREYDDKVNAWNRMKRSYTEEMQILQNQRITQLQKDVYKIANDMGKKQGFLLIVERKVGGVIYAPSQVDITNEVIKKYNAQTAKKK